MDGLKMKIENVYAFDFDGTLCDGLNECLLVTWNGYHGLEPEAFSDDGIRNLPESFVSRFQSLRNYAKHLGHFAVPLMTDAPILTQQDFDVAFNALNQDDVYDFVEKVTEYRHLVRQKYEDRWLAYHTFYPGVEQFLKSRTENLYVVTAKDARSVQAIFDANEIEIPYQNIFGEQNAKVVALDTIAKIEGVEKDRVLFFDDNVFNAIQAKQAGYSAFWAEWGYSVPSHFEMAVKAGMKPLPLDVFVTEEVGHAHAVQALQTARV